MGSGTMVGGFDGWLGASPGSGAGGSGGGGTLASIYAFGLGDNPFVDNNFPMDSGNWRWPGNTDWGTGRWGSAAAYFQNRAIDMSRAPAGELKSLAANLSGIGGNGCGAFDELVLNDPAWNGSSFGAIFFMAWVAEIVGFSNSVLQTSGMPAVEYARRTYLPTGQSPMVPGVAQIGAAMRDSLQLYNDLTATVPQVRSVSAYGDEEKLLNAVQNGASAQWVTHWTNNIPVSALGDGPAWWIDVDSRFGHFQAAAGLAAYQRTGGVFGAWGWRLWNTDGVTFPAAVPVLDVNTDGGLLNGSQIETLDQNGVAFYTLDMDYTSVAGTDLGAVVPARAGKWFLVHLYALSVVAVTGALTNNPSISFGSDAGTYVNLNGGAAIVAATVNAQGVRCFFASNLAGSTGTAPTSNAPIHAKMVLAVTGATALTVRLTVFGSWEVG